jgi:uncharacterized protein (TIGR04141 family)
MSGRTRPFSIFLLKQGYDSSNSLKDNNLLDEELNADSLPEGATLFILDNAPTKPWWKDYFGINLALTQSSKGALVFVPVQDRYFALSFGHVFHNLKDNCYEYDFGLRVTLNSLDPKKLKSADIVDPGASRRKRTQVPATTDLTFLDFDSNAEIVRSLTGKVKEEFESLFKSATGSSSLKIGLKIEPDQLTTVCERLLDLYSSQEYLISFPNVGKIQPEKDPDIVNTLDAQLIEKFINRSEDISLSIPDIIDYRDNTCCRFQGKGGVAEVYADVSLEAFYEYLGDDYNYHEITIEQLKSFSIVLCDADGHISKAYSIYNCLLLDIVEPEQIFHICEGGWYRVDSEYVQELKTYLDEKCEDTDLTEYNHDIVAHGINHYSEENYNSSMAQQQARFICLDQKDISPEGASQIEPCDLYSVTPTANGNPGLANLYHLKISTRSSQLSHLFNQGVNSAELLILEPSCREKLKLLITQNIGTNIEHDYCDPIEEINLKVIYGVITRKAPEGRSDNLPLFSKISLMRCFKSLELMQIQSALTYIPDASPPKEKYSTYPTVVVEVTVTNGDKKEILVVAGQTLPLGSQIGGCCSAIKESATGSKFELFYKENKHGNPCTHHSWQYKTLT